MNALCRHLVLAVVLVCGCACAAGAVQDAEKWVTDGQQVLDDRWNFPWYDAETGELAPIELPRERIGWDWKFPSFGEFLQDPLRVLFWALVVVLALGLIYVIARTLALSQWQKQPIEPELVPKVEIDAADALPQLRERPRDDLLGHARRYYQQGNYSEAIVYLFSYQLLRLDKSAIVELALGKTNRQYVREAATVRPLAALLETTMGSFEEVFFGGRTLDRERFEASWNRLVEFENLLAQAAR